MDGTRRQPNLAKFYAVYEYPDAEADEGTRVVHVMQLWEGGSLLDKVMALIRDARWNERYAALSFAQLLRGMQAMHESDGTGSFVHCDIKLDNMFVQDDEADSECILGDFGEVKWVPNDPGRNPLGEARVRAPIGTPVYAAPEQLFPDSRGSVVVSRAADMWSLGVTLYCMVCCQFPWPKSDRREMHDRIRSGRFFRFGSEVPADVRDLVASLLSLDPASRPSAAEALSHPWLERATSGDRAATIHYFNLPTTDASGGLMADLRSTLPSKLSFRSEQRGKELRGLLREIGGGLAPKQFQLLLDGIHAEIGKDADVRHAELSPSQFASVMDRLGIRGTTATRLFHAFDDDSSGRLSVAEFAAGLARITEPSEQRARIVFRMFDADGDGAVTFAELLDVLRSCATGDAKLEEVKAQRIVSLLSDMDADLDGTVTWEEFYAAVQRDPFIAKLLLQPNREFRRFVDLPASPRAGGAPASRVWDSEHAVRVVSAAAVRVVSAAAAAAEGKRRA